MSSINLANKFNLTENIILNLIKINSLIVAYMSPLAIASGLVVYILAHCQCYAFGFSLKT